MSTLSVRRGTWGDDPSRIEMDIGCCQKDRKGEGWEEGEGRGWEEGEGEGWEEGEGEEKEEGGGKSGRGEERDRGQEGLGEEGVREGRRGRGDRRVWERRG